MKKIFYTAICLVMMFVTSCGNSEENGRDMKDTGAIDSGTVTRDENVDSLQIDHNTDSATSDHSANGGAGLKKAEQE